MISVVIPYVHSNHDDLRYALRSWEKYADFEYNIWLIGEPPDWYTGNSIKMDRFMHNVARDIYFKLSEVIITEEITEEFIYSYDDIYLLKKTSLQDLKMKIASREVVRGETTPGTGSRVWKMRFEQTISQLFQHKIYGYETHLPRVLQKVIVKKIFQDYKLNENDLLFSTLYFNKYFNPPDVILTEDSSIKLGLYEAKTYDQIKQLYVDQQFLNHDDRGNTDGLKKFRNEKLNDFCKYEIEFKK